MIALDDTFRPPAEVAAAVRAYEAMLDPAAPETEGHARVLGYGEVSAALVLRKLPGWVCKRMTGFAHETEVERYARAVVDYLQELAAHRVAVAPTQMELLNGADGRPVVYLVQPLLNPDGLASNLLRTAPDQRLLACLDAALTSVERVLRNNANRKDGRVVAIDAQLSNWWFEDNPNAAPVLIDIGTPFMRRDGIDECGVEFLLAPVPWVLRWHYRRQRAVEQYIDDYFAPRPLALDLLGNFHKEGRPDRIATALPSVNAWLNRLGGLAPIDEKEVAAYYQADAAELVLYLRVRRIDRWLHRWVLRRRYPFILPGPVKR